jgi:hypothetical protein
MPMSSSSVSHISSGDQAWGHPDSRSRARLERRCAWWACHMAMMPIKAMIAENITLLIVEGSQVFEVESA